MLCERLQNQLTLLRAGRERPKPPRKRNFKAIRNERMQREILAEHNMLGAAASSSSL